MLLPKVWGGDRLARFGKAVAPGSMIGESWELADLGATSASGAGGGAVRSVISNGPLKGRTLHVAVEAWKGELLGTAALSPSGEFPLLVKYLDARENLSVQVHPSPAFAAANPGANLKTECWYILDAAPESVIYKGVRPGVSVESFAAHITDGTVVDDLMAIPAVVGECHNLPSGTVHALGAGVLVAEVQTPSDTTFRVFDWGRSGRALHIAESLQCIDFGEPPAPVDLRRGGVLRTPFFAVSLVAGAHREDVPLGKGAGCMAVMVLTGEGVLAGAGGTFAPLAVTAGQTVLVPAACSGGAMMCVGGNGSMEALVAEV